MRQQGPGREVQCGATQGYLLMWDEDDGAEDEHEMGQSKMDAEPWLVGSCWASASLFQFGGALNLHISNRRALRRVQAGGFAAGLLDVELVADWMELWHSPPPLFPIAITFIFRTLGRVFVVIAAKLYNLRAAASKYI